MSDAASVGVRPADARDGRFASIENIIAFDPGGRNVFGLVIPDQLRRAARSLSSARRVGIVSGFFLPDVGKSETDGPPGALALGAALHALGADVDYLTDANNADAFRAIGIEPCRDTDHYLDRSHLTHLVAIERPGRGRDGRYRNMNGEDITASTAPLDDLFLDADNRGVTTIGIGDGGNEIGMGGVFAEVLATVSQGDRIACMVSTDFCIAAGTSNWGAYGLVAALSVLCGGDLLPTASDVARVVERLVRSGTAVDGITRRAEPTTDGIPSATTIRLLENLRRQITPSPLRPSTPLRVGVLGYGETGRAAAGLLARRGHRVRVSDHACVEIEPGASLDNVEIGAHSIDFLSGCSLVVASPGVRPDAPIRNELHRLGIPVMSELEMAYQLCTRPIIAVTGTVGKRSTIELIAGLFRAAGRPLTVGGNKGTPLSAILLEPDQRGPIALAVSSFQLETVTCFNPRIAVILNIHEAHMDRHRSRAEYVRIKSRVFMNHSGTVDTATSDSALPCSNVLIVPCDDAHLGSLTRKHRGRTLFVSDRGAVDEGAWLERGRVHVRLDGDLRSWRWSGASDPGSPASFPENLLSAVLIACLGGVDTDVVDRTLRGLGRS